MIIVTNNSQNNVTRAGITFSPGENKFKDGDISEVKQVQIQEHNALKWVRVEDEPQEKTTKKGA